MYVTVREKSSQSKLIHSVAQRDEKNCKFVSLPGGSK